MYSGFYLDSSSHLVIFMHRDYDLFCSQQRIEMFSLHSAATAAHLSRLQKEKTFKELFCLSDNLQNKERLGA